MTERSRQWAIVWLAAILVLAAAVRLYGIKYGLPSVFNPDETPILNRALAFAKGDPNPHNFVYPTLYFYALFAWEALFFVAGRLAGVFESVADFQRQFFIDPSAHFLAGRVFSVVCGTATVAALFVLGRRLYGTFTGLAAAAFMAIAPVAARDAHYVKLDIPTTFMLVLAHVSLARIVVDPRAAARPKTWFIAGLLSGLAVSTQYYVVFVGLTIACVALADISRSGSWRRSAVLFLWCTAGCVVGFFAGTPFILVDFSKAVSDIAHVREVDVDRALAGGAGLFTATGAYLRILFRDAVGWPVALAAAAGAVWAVVSDWRRGLLVVSFSAAFFAFIANTVPMSRYVNAMLPYVALAAAFFVVRVASMAGRWAGPVAALLVILTMIPGLALTLRTDAFIRHADTRALALDFVHAQIPSGRSVLVQPHSVPVRQSREGLIEALRAQLGSEQQAPPKARLTLELNPYPQPSYRVVYLGDGGLDNDKLYVSPAAFTEQSALGPLRQLGVEYVILNQGNEPNPALQPLLAALAREGRRMAVFQPYKPGVPPAERAAIAPFMHNTAATIHPGLERPGPTVEVWDVSRRGASPAGGVQ
jgi:hypothetical protein